MRVPAPLRQGDVIGVTAPSSGVGSGLRPRWDVCSEAIRRRGFGVREGDCLFADGIVSASAEDRARELMAFLLDPDVHAVMPPWGGELLIDILPLLDFDALAWAGPKWFASWSDGTTFMLPLLLKTGWMSLHGMNAMDAVYTPPDEVARWWDVMTLAEGAWFVQRALPAYQNSFRDYRHDPTIDGWWPQVPTRWRRLGSDDDAVFGGRLVGGCADVISRLVGTPFGDVPRFAHAHAEVGTVVFLENCGLDAPEAARCWHQLVLAGWFAHCNGVLIGRTKAPESDVYTQREAVEDAFAPLVRQGIPVLYDVDIGHQPPQLLLVEGALARVALIDGQGTIQQALRP